MPQINVTDVAARQLADLSNLPKWRKDFLEVFGNTWGRRNHERQPLTAEEKAALEAATNPFRK